MNISKQFAVLVFTAGAAACTHLKAVDETLGVTDALENATEGVRGVYDAYSENLRLQDIMEKTGFSKEDLEAFKAKNCEQDEIVEATTSGKPVCVEEEAPAEPGVE